MLGETAQTKDLVKHKPVKVICWNSRSGSILPDEERAAEKVLAVGMLAGNLEGLLHYLIFPWAYGRGLCLGLFCRADNLF